MHEKINTEKTLPEIIREQLTQREIRMAFAAISAGVEALRKRNKEYSTARARYYKNGYGQAGGTTAASVLYNIFECCPLDCFRAMQKIAEDNPCDGGGQISLFDQLVEELNKRCGGMLRVRIAK